MNFLFDNNMSHPLARALRLLSQPVTHVRDILGAGRGCPGRSYPQPRGQPGLLRRHEGPSHPTDTGFSSNHHRRGRWRVLPSRGRARQLAGLDEAKLVIKAWDNVLRFAERNAPPFTASIQKNGQVKAIRAC